jgi:hypothetical protein
MLYYIIKHVFNIRPISLAEPEKDDKIKQRDMYGHVARKTLYKRLAGTLMGI